MDLFTIELSVPDHPFHRNLAIQIDFITTATIVLDLKKQAFMIMSYGFV